MDTAEYKRASHAVWEAMAPGWDDRHAYLEERARPVAERMLERLAPQPGETLLELAAGTGVVGFAAATLVRPSGRVVVSDFSRAMVDTATRRAAELGLDNVECRVLDAERLELPDATFDGVLCRWGYMLLGDPGAAFRETRRVLRPDGRLSCAVFARPEQNPWVTVPSRVLSERGHMSPPGSAAPGILALGDPERLRARFTEAGFPEPEIDEVPFVWTFRGPDDYWEFLNDTAGAIAMVLGRLDDDERRRVREEITARLPSSGADGLELPAASLVASAAL